MTLTIKHEDSELTDATLMRAIKLLQARHYPAMAICNAIGGLETQEWRAIHQHGRRALFAEAQERGLVIPERQQCDCCGEWGAENPTGLADQRGAR